MIDIDDVLFCKTCRTKWCQKTKKICKRLDKWFKKHVEVKFWHAIEGNLSKANADFMQNKLYAIDNKDDMEEF